MTDHNEAMRLAEWLQQNSSGVYRPAAEAAALIRKQAERIAELELQPAFAQLASDLAVKLADTEAERDTLRAEVERLKPNAERYQWLRDNHKGQWAICEDNSDGLGYYRDARLPSIVDTAIDTARKATQ